MPFSSSFTKYTARWMGATNTAQPAVQLIDQPTTPQAKQDANKFALGSSFVGFEEEQLERNRGALEFEHQYRSSIPTAAVPFVDTIEDEAQILADGSKDKYADLKSLDELQVVEPEIVSPSTEVRKMLREHDEGHNRFDVLQLVRKNFSDNMNRAVKCEESKPMTIGEKLKAKP